MISYRPRRVPTACYGSAPAGLVATKDGIQGRNQTYEVLVQVALVDIFERLGHPIPELGVVGAAERGPCLVTEASLVAAFSQKSAYCRACGEAR